MNVEQDYIMRMIKEFANVLGRLLFNKKKPMYELDVTNRYHVGDDLYTRLCRMADEGKINEAENLLYEEMVPGDMDYLEMALAFYAYLNCFEDEVLHRYHYTRDEIKEGMEDFLDRYGCGVTVTPSFCRLSFRFSGVVFARLHRIVTGVSSWKACSMDSITSRS